MLPALCAGDLRTVNSEPRIQDLRLAERLEFERPRKIRELIERNREELERYGALPCHRATPSGGGPTASEYWLNEAQALLLCMKSDAPRAEDIREEIIAVFLAWRHGELAPRSAGEVTLASIRGVVREEIEPVRQEVAEVRGQVIFLNKRVDDIVPRRDFPKAVRDKCIYVVHLRYAGRCTCGCHTRIVDEQGNPMPDFTLDHYNGRERNGLEDALPVAIKCNWKLREAEFKQSRRPHYLVFQGHVKSVYSGHLSAATTKSNIKQLSLFGHST